jgi:hypothetical protein
MARGLLDVGLGEGDVLPYGSALRGFGLCGFGGREDRDSGFIYDALLHLVMLLWGWLIGLMEVVTE